MPKIYEYFGIVFFFYSEEHKPIHVHVKDGSNEMVVSFFLRDGQIYRTTYKTKRGKFSPKKEKQIKAFISEYNTRIVNAWIDFFILGNNIQPQKITKRIK